MAGIIAILSFLLLMSPIAGVLSVIPDFTSQKEGMDSGFRWVQSNNQAVLAKENKTEYVKFGVRIPNRPVSGKYSLAFTIEPARKDSVLRKGKVAVGTKRRAEVRIILDIPERIEDKKVELPKECLPSKPSAGGIRGLKGAYDRRLPPGKYLAEEGRLL